MQDSRQTGCGQSAGKAPPVHTTDVRGWVLTQPHSQRTDSRLTPRRACLCWSSAAGSSSASTDCRSFTGTWTSACARHGLESGRFAPLLCAEYGRRRARSISHWNERVTKMWRQRQFCPVFIHYWSGTWLWGESKFPTINSRKGRENLKSQLWGQSHRLVRGREGKKSCCFQNNMKPPQSSSWMLLIKWRFFSWNNPKLL